MMAHGWVDVWRLTKEDTGTQLEAGVDDVFAVEFEDNSSSGYLWALVDTGDVCEVLGERVGDVSRYGDPLPRTVFLRFRSPGSHVLLFEHRRPWNKQRLEQIQIRVDNYGKEMGGYSRRARLAALEVA